MTVLLITDCDMEQFGSMIVHYGNKWVVIKLAAKTGTPVTVI